MNHAHIEPVTAGSTTVVWFAFLASVFTTEASIVVSIILGLTGIAATSVSIWVGRKKARGLDLDNKMKMEQLERMKKWRE